MDIAEHEWIRFVTQRELNETVNVAIRISDNILDEKDWPVHILRFNEKGICIQQQEKNKGVYKIDDFVGKNLNDLCEWSNYDMTGSEGELSHDLCVLIYF